MWIWAHQMYNCRNSISSQSSMPLQSSSVRIMVTVTAHRCNSKSHLLHHWEMFATKITQIKAAPVDAGWALCYCRRWWMIDSRRWVHTIHSAPCGSLHFHTGTVCLSATDSSGTYALTWASSVVFCQSTASRTHACPTYHRGDPLIHACMSCRDRLEGLDIVKEKNNYAKQNRSPFE